MKKGYLSEMSPKVKITCSDALAQGEMGVEGMSDHVM